MNNSLKIILICAVAAVTTATGLWLWQKQNKAHLPGQIAEKAYMPVKPQPVINYNKLQDITKKRKAKYGLKKGVDIIVRSDESFKVGELTVSMQEIRDKIRLKSGDIIEKDIKPGKITDDAIDEFGIYVVRPGDSLWAIHFKFLKDYFDQKNIAISPLADEPDRFGYSSGVGKLLKFSEKTVCIYNLKEKKLDVDINLIFPLSKIVVYNMSRIFALLDHIDYQYVNKIQFDGETIWIPAER
ncbi:MAG: hypothetical protein ISS67_01590 [Desulfobacterales bacterium]|uniref:Uncharacterized protein n=1 Tax=Candidatus Desulfaltia bathyphila TaxID=2841697 RepID=A0A8J6TC77_9BACT|nr:hypothetical protein [Candidatus Desulfaltia bathyphila]MBL7194810.1 hypothetical protein [Desulfobacterales bacterium]MBL7207205.1 hypothetical protein [Desulfobacterales bacterium]